MVFITHSVYLLICIFQLSRGKLLIELIMRRIHKDSVAAPFLSTHVVDQNIIYIPCIILSICMVSFSWLFIGCAVFRWSVCMSVDDFKTLFHSSEHNPNVIEMQIARRNQIRIPHKRRLTMFVYEPAMGNKTERKEAGNVNPQNRMYICRFEMASNWIWFPTGIDAIWVCYVIIVHV